MPGVNDVYRVTALGNCNGQTTMLTHHYRTSQFPAGATDAQVRQRLLDFLRGDVGGDDLWETAFLACMPQNYTFERWDVQKVFTTRQVFQSYVRNVPGNFAANAETPNIAGVVTLRTDDAGRSQVSNKHIGPLPTDPLVYVNGLIQNAYKGLLETLVNGLGSTGIDIVAPWQFDPVIYHRGPVPGSSLITSQVAQDTVRVMRRRTVGLGI